MVGLVGLPLMLGGVTGTFQTLQEGGMFSWLALAAFLMGTVANSVIAALGRPLGAMVAVSAVPWLLGVFGTFMGQNMIDRALSAADPSQLGLLYLAGTAETMATRALGAYGSTALAVGAAVVVLLRDPRRWALALLSGALGLCGLVTALASLSLKSGLGAVVNASPDMKAMLLAEALTQLRLYEVVRTGALGLVLISVVVAVALAFVQAEQKVSATIAGLLAFAAIGADEGAVRSARDGAEQRAVRQGSEPDFEPLELSRGTRYSPALRVTPKEVVAFREDRRMSFGDPKLGASLAKAARGGALSIELDRRTKAPELKRLIEAAASQNIDMLELVGRQPPPNEELLMAADHNAPFVVLASQGLGGIALRISADSKALRATVRPGASLELKSADGTVADTVGLNDPPAGERGMGQVVALTLEESATASALAQAAQVLERSGFKVALVPPTPQGALMALGAESAGLGEALGMLGGLGTKSSGIGTGYKNAGTLGSRKSAGVSSGRPVVMGSLDKEIIRRVIRSRLAQVRYCYEKELVKKPSLQGKVSTKFVISGAGKVVSATVRQSTMGSKAVEQCIVKVIKRLRFPKPKGGGIVVVNYPFVLKSAK